MLIKENIVLLESLEKIIEMLTDEQYVSVDERYFSSTVGAHARHILDHYSVFVQSLDCGDVNYDLRAREHEIEVDRGVATGLIRQLISELSTLVDADMTSLLIVRSDLSLSAGDSSQAQHSSIGRELTFLHSHSVHHHAYIAFILRVMGVETLPAETGLAPATVRYQEQRQCVR